jgi:hypothetical protein
MALAKEKITEFGIRGSYWKLVSIDIDFITGKFRVVLSLYAGRFATSMKPLESKGYLIPITAQQLVTGNLRAIAYDYIKANDSELEGAVNV